MYNPFPPTAGGVVGVLAATGANSTGIAIAAIILIIGGLVLLRTAQMRKKAHSAE